MTLQTLELDERADAIQSREDFVSFVHALVVDLRENPGEWENADLGRYLDALARWVGAMDQLYRNLGEPLPHEPGWNTLGQMLYAARIYE